MVSESRGKHRLTSDLDEVHQQGRLKHPVQPHVAVGQQVGQTAPRTVFHHQSEDPRVQKQPQVQVQVLVTHLSELDGTAEKRGLSFERQLLETGQRRQQVS